MSLVVMSPWKAAEACLARTINKVSDLLIYEQELLLGFEKEFRFIETEMGIMQLMLKSVKGREGAMSSNNNEPVLKMLTEDMRLLASRVDSVTEAFILRKRKRQSCWSIIMVCVPIFRNQTEIRKLIAELSSIKSSIFELVYRGNELGLTPKTETRKDLGPVFPNLELPEGSSSCDDIDEGEAVSLDEDASILVSRLIGGKGGRRVISITGGTGTGKTTLALKVHKNATIAQNFPARAWVTLPREFEVKEILEIIAKQLIVEFQEVKWEWTEKELMKRINRFLRYKRYFIVLDNIMTYEAWEILRAVFPSTSDACVILMTTPDRALAVSTESNPDLSSVYDMRVLSDEESWDLFKRKVHVPAELEQFGREIVKKCNGLPLAILKAAEFLSSKPTTPDQWLAVVKQIDRNQVSLYYTLNLAADALPSNLKLCLSYFGLFPRDYYIPVRKLIVLWIAEGLVQQHMGSKKPPEYVAEKYLLTLENLKMIQVGKRKPEGKIKTCRMHYLLRGQWESKGKEANFVHSPSETSASTPSSSSGTIRRLADKLDSKDDSFSHIHGDKSTNHSLRSCYRDLRSILSFDSREGPVPGDEIGSFLRRGIAGRWFIRLRVIDLERVFRPKLPKAIGKLVELRYLGLRWTYLELLPSSIGKLLNLQTLDLKHTNIGVLPSYIWKMLRLRHLYLTDSYRIRFLAPPSPRSLIDLRTLWGVFLDEESPIKGGLDRLLNIRKLGLVCRLTLSQQMALAKLLPRLSHLESLRLRSIDESVQPSDLRLQSLSGLENLSTIYLLGRLVYPTIVNNFPKNVTEITLTVSGLTEDPMPKLEKLRNLRILRLLSGSYTGKTMCCSTGGFRLLRVLLLWNLEELEEWVVENGALTIVKEIEIRCCKKMTKIPHGFKHLTHCRELKLKGMPEEFKARVIKDQGADWYKIADIPSVYIENEKI